MFSESTAPIETYYVPIDSDFHGDGPCKIYRPWASTGCSCSLVAYKAKFQWMRSPEAEKLSNFYALESSIKLPLPQFPK